MVKNIGKKIKVVIANVEKSNLKEYYDIYKENISEKGKQYRLDNNEKIKEREQKYRETRKVIRKEKMKEKTTCECGCEITKNNLKRHQSSKSHLELMNKK